MPQRKGHSRKDHDRVLSTGEIIHVKAAMVKETTVNESTNNTQELTFAEQMKLLADHAGDEDNSKIKAFLAAMDNRIKVAAKAGKYYLTIGGVGRDYRFPCDIVDQRHAFDVVVKYYQMHGFYVTTANMTIQIAWKDDVPPVKSNPTELTSRELIEKYAMFMPPYKKPSD